ncbi:heavy metal translocating P-type ATPase [Arcticibacter eurypsychrophilus]|uniref:heavy metal translocating P-type ATPase n=1 Tax=Arcticibacter eurypsychrophilus TaxID=1434752 RepID=UPI00084DB905|nr:heavy metal translocating P-type ATPase [Arcticibacter eurypsychrophilus]
MSSNHNNQDHNHNHDCSHNNEGVFGSKTELIFSILAGSLLTVGFLLSLIPSVSHWFSLALYLLSFFFGGFYAIKEAVLSVLKGKFDIDFLMIVAAIGAASLDKWAEGALLLFLFSLGHGLEHSAMDKAKKSIAALAELAPKVALVRRDGQDVEIPIDQLVVGDIVIVKPNSKISADGVVIKGQSAVNQAPITGESIPVDKIPVENIDQFHSDNKIVKPENQVFAGTINGNQVLEVEVTNLTEDSTLARLIKLVSDTKAQKSQTQLLTDEIQVHYVPAVIALVLLLLCAFLVVDESFGDSFYRAMAVLVAASPCALAISTPSAVLSGIARGARGGVLFKGGGPLEELGGLTAIAFDKTGTLTEGKPKLTGVTGLNGISEEEVLEVAVAVEKMSDHPLAAAIVKGAQDIIKKEISPAQHVEALNGHGVKAELNGSTILIGNSALFKDLPEEISSQVSEKEQAGNTTIIVQRDHIFIGLISVMDVPRVEAMDTIKRLKKLGIKRMVMLTGDNQQVAESVAKQIGIKDAWGGLLPEQKLKAIEDLLKREERVAMVGDGVNDAPAMAKSSVGIAMGAAGSHVALETADVALMANNLDNLPFAIGLSRKSHRIIRQNLVISLGMVAILVPLTIVGVAGIGPAVVGHEGSTLLVVFNGLRLLAYKQK